MARVHSIRSILPDPLGELLEPHARIMQLRPGQIVIGHQDRTTDVFVILEGSLRVELHSLNGREIILADIGAGELFGEFSALDDAARSATVSATSVCRLACIAGERFRLAALADPASAEWLARRLVNRVRLLTERIFELNALAVRDRLHCELLRLCIEAGIRDNRSSISPVPTHAQLASRIGTHREAVTREMQYLQKASILAQSGRDLAVNDVARLADIVRKVSGDVGVIPRADEASSSPGVANIT